MSRTRPRSPTAPTRASSGVKSGNRPWRSLSYSRFRSGTRKPNSSSSSNPNGALPSLRMSSWLRNWSGVSGSGSSMSRAQRTRPSWKPTWKAPTRSKPDPCPPGSFGSMPDRILHPDHRDQPGTDVVVGERDARSVACGGTTRPGAGDAVGLLFGGHGRQVELERAGAGLDRMAVLVGEHDADRGGARIRWPTGRAARSRRRRRR